MSNLLTVNSSRPSKNYENLLYFLLCSDRKFDTKANYNILMCTYDFLEYLYSTRTGSYFA